MPKLAPTSRNGTPPRRAKNAPIHGCEVVHEWERSGLTQPDFCRRHSIPIGTFSWWKWQLGVLHERHQAAARRGQLPTARPQPSDPPVLHPVRVVDSRSWAPAPLEVVLAGGRVLRVCADFDAAVLSKLVWTLEGAPC